MLVAKEVVGDEPSTVFKNERFTVQAMPVPHGIVPAVAFKVTVGDQTLVFASDQNGSKPAFSEFARDANLLVMHLVIPESAEGVASRLHARPSVVGHVADGAGSKKLVLSHFMARSLRELERNVELVRTAYDGEVLLAEDLVCVVPAD